MLVQIQKSRMLWKTDFLRTCGCNCTHTYASSAIFVIFQRFSFVVFKMKKTPDKGAWYDFSAHCDCWELNGRSAWLQGKYLISTWKVQKDKGNTTSQRSIDTYFFLLRLKTLRIKRRLYSIPAQWIIFFNVLFLCYFPKVWYV